MFGCTLWMTLFIVFGMTKGNAFTDIHKCVSRENGDLAVAKSQFCIVKKNDVDIFCPRDMSIALSSLQLAIKNSTESCMRRILTPRDFFCCTTMDNDILYDSTCILDAWTVEDKEHYKKFFLEALRKCENSSHCVLNSDMFKHLQTNLPMTAMYSSYFQIIHHCVKAPSEEVKMCSSLSTEGKELHVRGGFSHTKDDNRTCTCRVTSTDGHQVIVRAADVRTSSSWLMLRSSNRETNISTEELPLFGFKQIFEGQQVHISMKPSLVNSSDNILLHISESNGHNVSIVCGDSRHGLLLKSTESTHTTKRTSTLPVFAVASGTTEVFMGFWPVLYLSAGSVCTLIVLGCVIGAVLIFRQRFRQMRMQRYHRSQSARHVSPDSQKDIQNPPYSTLLVDISQAAEANPELNRNTLGRPTMTNTIGRYHRPTSIPGLRRPIAPTLPSRLTRGMNAYGMTAPVYSRVCMNTMPRLSSRNNTRNNIDTSVSLSPQPPELPQRSMENNTSDSLLRRSTGNSSDVSEIDSLLGYSDPGPSEQPLTVGATPIPPVPVNTAVESQYPSLLEVSQPGALSQLGFDSLSTENSNYFVLECLPSNTCSN